MKELSVNEKIERLRMVMKGKGVDVYYTTTTDFHNSEYIQDYFKEVYYISGFSGSNGSVIVTADEAYLYTDGRYFIQAEGELSGSEVILMKMGEKDVLKEEELIDKLFAENGFKTLCFDGRMISSSTGMEFRKRIGDGEIVCDINLLDYVWTDRYKLRFEKVYDLPLKYSGESFESKLGRVREYMKSEGADGYVLSSLCDIAWLLNLRGDDIECNPVFFSYLYIKADEIYIYSDENAGVKDALGKTIESESVRESITYKAYDDFYEDIKNILKKDSESDFRLLTDLSMSSYRLLEILEELNIFYVDKFNITTNFKAVKNEVELENLRKAHVYDGVAVTKFIYWLKNNIGKITITEKTAEEKLLELRKECDSLIGLSFDTISAYGANAAMMHYEALEDCATLKPDGMLLVDSGGHYYEGTTDITRTIVLGKLTDKEKMYYTLSLKGMLNLSNAKFLYGCTGLNLDMLARGPLWKLGMDYKCGTGHGVGYLLSVHEAPNGFRWRKVPERNDGCVLEEGMVTTIEPGVYIENEFGIRIENELICKKAECNEYGQFMDFETITFCPVDLDAVDVSYLDESDIVMLNEYSKKVWEVISPFLNEEEREWLSWETRELHKSGGKEHE